MTTQPLIPLLRLGMIWLSSDLSRKLRAMASGLAFALVPGCGGDGSSNSMPRTGVSIPEVMRGEDVFSYVNRVKGGFDQPLYQAAPGCCPRP